MGPVMYADCCFLHEMIDNMHSGAPAFEKITGYFEKAKQAGGEILIGGTCK